jgi:hypothetical protein
MSSAGTGFVASPQSTRIMPAKINPGSKKKDISWSYNKYKHYGGKQYTGMAIGRGHKWYYDKGVWIDRKLTPERWIINYAVTKRRAGKAPEGSGAPVGTEYHWYILAHQMVKKLDANSYSTAMNGYKFKLAHKRNTSDKWNITDKTQRNHLVKILKEFIAELEAEPIEEFVEESTDILKKLKGDKAKKTSRERQGEPQGIPGNSKPTVRRKRAAKKAPLKKATLKRPGKKATAPAEA